MRYRIVRKPEPITLPQEVLDRVNRVYGFHLTSKLSFESVHNSASPADRPSRPSPYRVFDSADKVALPTSLLDMPIPTLDLLAMGVESLPESFVRPPQDMKTLASWLYMSYGLTHQHKAGSQTLMMRPTPSAGALYPCEIYVAAFSIQGLAPGLYHYSPKEFALRKLRDGPQTMSRIRRGRPDLEFIKNVPAVLLVSTIFWRSVWKYRLRGYRYCLLDAGHLTQSLATVANGLGIRTVTRLHQRDNAMAELIGVPADAPFGEAESVQSMVIWADAADSPQQSRLSPGTMAPIARAPLSDRFIDYPQVIATHRDCVAAGVASMEVRPPLSDLDPLPPEAHNNEMPAERVTGGAPLRQVMLTRRSASTFAPQPIARDQFVEINRLAFRGGTFFPLLPKGPHVAMIRPFWMVHDVSGVNRGVWYYDPINDAWSMLVDGDWRFDTSYLCMEQAQAGEAAAVCFMSANLHALMTQAGPDAYRVMHLEAGVVGQRIAMAATAMGLGVSEIGAFYDDDVRKTLTMEGSGWEVIYAVAVGVSPTDEPKSTTGSTVAEMQWRD